MSLCNHFTVDIELKTNVRVYFYFKLFTKAIYISLSFIDLILFYFFDLFQCKT